jgi:oxygen-independent coproporphyrinogen-3 oxidase
MEKQFIEKSKNLLLHFLEEPGGFSFFPSSFLWKKNISREEVKSSYIQHFNTNFSHIDDTNNKVNLYIHIPFCTKICSYCNCFKKKLEKKEEIDTYIGYLKKEIDLIKKINGNKKIGINTIFI